MEKVTCEYCQSSVKHLKPHHQTKKCKSYQHEKSLMACLEGNLDKVKEIYKKSGVFAYNAFGQTCQKGHLKVGKWLWKYNLTEHKIQEYFPNIAYIFFETCLKGHLEVAKWLWIIIKNDINIFNNRIPHIFNTICVNGNLELARWYKSNLETKYNPFNYSDAFHYACINKNLQVAKWLWSIIEFQEEVVELNRTISMCFDRGNLEILKWLSQIDEEILHEEAGFWLSCKNGHFEVAKWLWEYDCGEWIDIHCKNEAPFHGCCVGGYVEIAKWLWNISNQTIDVRVNNDLCFRRACENGHLEVGQWLVSLCPTKYKIGENNEPIINKTFIFPQIQGECLVCTENKICCQVPCCKKEFCHDCLQRIDSETCSHCRQQFSKYNYDQQNKFLETI